MNTQNCSTKLTKTGVSDFDFFIGNWKVLHRRLQNRLANCHVWDHFEGSCFTQKILGGLGNFDDNVLNFPSGPYCAITIRTFNPETNLWSIWWLDGRFSDQIDSPMIGSFQNSVGTFYAKNTINGQAIKVRFLWTISVEKNPRWEQAFSVDDGLTWETNWMMDFFRIEK